MRAVFPIIGTFLLAARAAAGGPDWPDFLARHDLVWPEVPDRWESGAFVGNGRLGAMIYSAASNTLAWELGRSDVVDRRPGADNPLVNKARLPIGFFQLTPAGRVTNGAARLDLWHAEARGRLETTRGALAWRCFAHATEDVLVIELEATPDERAAGFDFLPAVSETSRPRHKGKPADYQPNPPPTRFATGAVSVCAQPLLHGGGYATAWRERADGATRRIFISIGYATNGSSAGQAVAAVERAAAADFATLERAHRAWWHAYYPRSFLSIPDAKLESLYWIQMYKLGAATRADGPALDLLGPWYHQTLWPGIWWNLNIQAAYHPVYTANRLEQGESLCRMLDAAAPALMENVRHYKQFVVTNEAATLPRVTSYDCAGGMWKGQEGCPEVGNLAWACHNYWRQCRYAGDDARLRERFLPLLRRAMNFYLGIMEEGADGKFHLPCTYSPELWYAPDCNYDLASFDWGLRTLIAEHQRLGLAHPDLPRWRETLARLVPFPADTNGFMVGRDVPFQKLHRHYSHLLMIHPYYTVTLDQPEHRALIGTSMDHWMRSTGAFAGYSYAAAASLRAAQGRGDEAVALLHEFLQRLVHPNTMYTEADSPCIESPLAAAQSIHDLLLQDWGGVIRVFPAAPTAWADAVFADLRTAGAFLVSARRADGWTRWVRVRSEGGGRCVIRPGLAGDVRATIPLQALGGETYALQLPAGGEALLYVGEPPPALDLTPRPAAERNFFGGNRRK